MPDQPSGTPMIGNGETPEGSSIKHVPVAQNTSEIDWDKVYIKEF